MSATLLELLTNTLFIISYQYCWHVVPHPCVYNMQTLIHHGVATEPAPRSMALRWLHAPEIGINAAQRRRKTDDGLAERW
jgi:hypothetical protein